ncbi:hypothetical protein FIBSPDRAFT_885969 [Athelia psychrophila]|uniref:Uncharacterized protein n=1 Tax=Athelia psychrophila TaxID=1759441 RepID=A0A166RAL5_9AGAM|nr:hypothetical protein FIBSPDRAFT_885969 [Fibularhizoctonia sp. CBS 109695]
MPRFSLDYLHTMNDLTNLHSTTPPTTHTTHTTHTSSTPHRASTYSPGPRPLQLAQASLSTSACPSPTRSDPPGSAREPGTPRRQSSISYYSPLDSEKRVGLAAARAARHSLTKSMSVGGKDENLNRRSVHPDAPAVASPAGPHTLAEKHSDLLQFIAQKESKCLELRSQLAVHEAELLQLKRKWERIINRGFERSHGIGKPDTSGSSSPLSSSPVAAPFVNAPQSGAMMDGIREGVQGMSRFLAAGLGELSAPSATSAAPGSPTPAPLSAARIDKTDKTHSNQPSNSSVATSATGQSASTRFSLSSASSLGLDEDDAFGEYQEGKDGGMQGMGMGMEDEDTGGEQVLMVRDTGATPTMSPNPAFEVLHHSGPISPAAAAGVKLHRRKSQGASPAAVDAAVRGAPTGKGGLRAKRGVGTGLPPASAAPLGTLALTAGGADVGGWVGSMGKKWEEIQKGAAFTKSQKRASVLLSGVSSTIASALSSPPLASASYNPAFPGAPFQSRGSGVSLLDGDDTAHGGLGAVMTPTVAPAAVKAADEDEDWGW